MANSEGRPRRHVLLTVHGIRDLGHWQNELSDLARQQGATIEFVPFQFNYFDVFSFLIPFARWLVVRRFRAWLRSNRVLVGDADRVDILSHSFGTYVVAHALARLSKDDPLRVNTLVLCGSVLRQSFRWERLLDTDRVGRVINECSIYDKPLIVSQLLVLGTGMAGKVGFPGPTTHRFINRYHGIGHGGFFHTDFVARRLLPLFVADPSRLVEPVDERNRKPSRWERVWYTLLNNSDPLKLAIYATPPLLVFAMAGWFYMQARIHEERLASSRKAIQMAQLAESAKFVDRDPALVLEALLSSIQNLDQDVQYALRLQRTLRRVDPERQNTNQLLERLALLNQALADLEPVLANSPTFWHLKGLLHKEQFLTGRNDSSAELQALGNAFQKAIKRYGASRSVPLVLCHLDYANCLLQLEKPKEAHIHFATALQLAATHLPKWIRAESHFGIANATRHFDVRLARQELSKAISTVAGDASYLADCGRYQLRLGWFYMDGWDWRSALAAFRRAEELLDGPSKLDFAAKINLYHARHGIVMASAYRNVDESKSTARHWREAAEGYWSLIQELLELTTTPDGDVLTRRQRQLLRQRILNSYERRGDTLLTRPEINPADAAAAAAYYREAAEFARNAARNGPESTWNASVIRILCKQTAALAIASDFESAEETFREAAATDCELGLSSTRASLQLNLELAKAIVKLANESPSEAGVVANSLRRRITEVVQDNRQTGWRPRRDDLEFLMFVKTCLDQVAPESESDRRMPLHHVVASILADYQLTLDGFTPGVEYQAVLRPDRSSSRGQALSVRPLHERFQFKQRKW